LYAERYQEVLRGPFTPSTSPTHGGYGHSIDEYDDSSYGPSVTGCSMVTPYGPSPRGHAEFYGPPDFNDHDFMSPSGYGNQYRRSSRDEENSIDIYAIQAGTDVRTTVMLRNVPNRVNCHQLKAMLDITSHGRYDFMYLRIDFANQCNVGYAFINFATPEDIIPFALARQRRRWTMFNSSKHAQISYASEYCPLSPNF
jgi:hypothetical protein